MTIGKILALLIERSIVISLLRLNASIISQWSFSTKHQLYGLKRIEAIWNTKILRRFAK